MPQTSEVAFPNELITTSTAAHILERGESTVRWWLNRGRLRAAMRTPTGLVLYRRADVEQLRDQLKESRG